MQERVAILKSSESFSDDDSPILSRSIKLWNSTRDGEMVCVLQKLALPMLVDIIRRAL